MKLSECRIGTLVTCTTTDHPTLKLTGYVSGLVELVPKVEIGFTALRSECLDLIEEAERRAVDNDLGDRAYKHAIVRLKQYLKTGETSFFAGKEKS